MTESSLPQFQVGGAVAPGAFYVARAADRELLAALQHMEFCYVLAPRQIGKSSLRVRTKQRLEEKNVRCATIDLTTIGSRDCTIEQWYFGLIDELAQQFDLTHPDQYWQQNLLKSPVHRFFHYVREILKHISEQVVIFIDELDAILAQPHISRDDFFAAVRAFYNSRAEDPAYQRLTFCLIGVAVPSDLIADETRTPFNIGKCITIDDFTRDEINEFLPGIERLNLKHSKILDEIFSWTSGHPYMTQKICHDLTLEEVSSLSEACIVERMITRIFLQKGRILEANLSYTEKVFNHENSTRRTTRMLRLYGKLRAGELISAQGQDTIQMALRLSGIAAERREEDGVWLRVRNRVFATVFDQHWVRRQESERVIAEPLSRWLEFNRSEDYVLRGQALEAARLWSRSQAELTPEEASFILASVDVAEREAMERHEREAAHRAAEHARQENVRLTQQLDLARSQQRNILLLTEGLERFAFYLVLSLLALYMNERLQLTESATFNYLSWLLSFIYVTPLIGGLIADRFLGYRRAILMGCCLLCGGYFLLIWADMIGLYLSFALLIIGNGFYKPNIITLIGHLYSYRDPRRDSTFSLYYMSINLGSALAPPIGEALRQNLGWGAAFSASGIAMIISGMMFGSYRHQLASIERPFRDAQFKDVENHIDESKSLKWKRINALARMCLISILFWMSFQQSAYTFVFWFRDNTNRVVTIMDFRSLLHLKFILINWEIPPPLLAILTPAFVLLLAPILVLIFKKLRRLNLEPTTLFKICIGMTLTGLAYVIMLLAAQHGMTQGKVSIWWLVSGYFLISVAELLVAPMAPSAVAKLAPQRMTAMMMGIWFISTSIGNSLAGQLGSKLWNRWSHASFYGLVAVIAIGSAALLWFNQHRITAVIETEIPHVGEDAPPTINQ